MNEVMTDVNCVMMTQFKFAPDKKKLGYNVEMSYLIPGLEIQKNNKDFHMFNM